MANKNILLIIPVIVFVIGMTLVSCDIGPKEEGDPKYTVRTGTMSYTDYQALVRSLGGDPTLRDGYWGQQELATEEFNQFVSIYNSSAQVANKNQNNWTKNQLIDYFMGRGFDNTKANEAASLVVTTNHIMIVSRSGSIVYVLIK